jgi:hypothetical protein
MFVTPNFNLKRFAALDPRNKKSPEAQKLLQDISDAREDAKLAGASKRAAQDAGNKVREDAKKKVEEREEKRVEKAAGSKRKSEDGFGAAAKKLKRELADARKAGKK